MAATLLSQLDGSIKSLMAEASSADGIITDSSESFSDFCLLLERVFMYKSKSRDKRDYWSFLQNALKKTTAQPLVEKIQVSSDNKTPVGKARCLLRSCLSAKSLGGVLQVSNEMPDAYRTGGFYKRQEGSRAEFPQRQYRQIARKFSPTY